MKSAVYVCLLTMFYRRCCRRFTLFIIACCVLASTYFLARPIYEHFVNRRSRTTTWSLRQQWSNLGLPEIESQVGVQSCVHPQLILWHPLLKHLFPDPAPLNCSKSEYDWIAVKNGTFQIQKEAIRQHGKISCQFIPIVHGNDDFEISKKGAIKPMRGGDDIVSDTFEAKCVGADGATYRRVHVAIAKSKEVLDRSKTNIKNIPSDSLGLNIVMFGFDSVSRMTWLRNLPKTNAYFTEKLGGVVFEGYNIVGDGTPQALLPMLTGKTEVELPEARRGFSGATNVDGHPWIWNRLKDIGYVTQWGEQSPDVGTFTYRMLGFREQPVDHYLRTYYLASDRDNIHYSPFCTGATPRHQIMINWLTDFMDSYPSLPKFSFVFHSEYTHGGYSELRLADGDVKTLLERLNRTGHLNNTLLIVMSDHGARFQKIRNTEQGKYEERMPYFGVRLPPWFTDKYPEVLRNLRTNAHRLTTPFDVGATFDDVIHFGGTGLGDVKERGISLFKEIPAERRCIDADIAPHWCACMSWNKIFTNDSRVQNAAQEVVNTMNRMTVEQRGVCAELSVAMVTSAVSYSANSDLLKFRQSADSHGRVPDLNDNMVASEILYQVTLTSLPGEGLYEATVKYTVEKGVFLVNGKEISRINKYGSQPHCVMERFPHLRPYCYCRVQRS